MKFRIGLLAILSLILILHGPEASAQDESKRSPAVTTGTLSPLKMRSIGPALMSGRIADIAIDAEQPNTWYVAAGSGNLWKTINAGTTWTPIFERYGSYSIGCMVAGVGCSKPSVPTEQAGAAGSSDSSDLSASKSVLGWQLSCLHRDSVPHHCPMSRRVVA